jgi:hypothetical protein
MHQVLALAGRCNFFDTDATLRLSVDPKRHCDSSSWAISELDVVGIKAVRKTVPTQLEECEPHFRVSIVFGGRRDLSEDPTNTFVFRLTRIGSLSDHLDANTWQKRSG